MDCKNVLVIEDELEVREAIRDVLELQGYNVMLAADGFEAVETIQSLKKVNRLPCMILLDLMMPKMNGWEFLDFHKSDTDISHIPVVICSAYKESAVAIKPAAVITKPIQRTSLLQAVGSFCA